MINMKICDICGTYNSKENKYCFHCGNKLLKDNICPLCTTLNEDDAAICSNCGSPLSTFTIESFDILFSDYYKEQLANFDLLITEYYSILNDIFNKQAFAPIVGSTAKDKVLDIASKFAKCKTKSRGVEFGANMGTTLEYDDRLDDSVQIATIIHELAHCLLFKIILNVLCEAFDVKTSKTLESFVWFFLTFGELEIMFEYCAHTVEGRFIPYGYQNYGSFNNLVKQSDISEDNLELAIILGNSFANEIIVYLEKYIDDDLRNLIKIQYKKDSAVPKFDSIELETNQCLDLDLKNKQLIQLLNVIFDEATLGRNRDELMFIKEGLENF